MFMLENHGVDYTDPRTKKAFWFDIDQYVHHRRFLDKRKLASHLFGLIISQMRVYAGVEPSIEDRKEEKANYDCGIYIMKWLETIDPRKIKTGKRYQYKAWTQEEIYDFRHEYGPNILLHEMNKIRDQVIRASEAIRLPKLSAVLSSPYCKFSSADLDSK
ncbi:hypothetical protein Ahy_A07g032181 [Arachis hypogaea]|uniref:Ubiquitin-like protease family profile domain-containing protein n=1 Tax=Arachis hypogaea TaxID=3818 RepID=A0A445C6D1_ARAHY|nr:hypothetical protein Ahy_A07g032181 [Arachis hypogaea]